MATIKKFSLLLMLFVGINAISYGQNESKKENTMYMFTLDGVQDLAQLELVKAHFENMEFVEKVKVNYKDEKATKGQIIIYVSEPVRSSESQVMFQPTNLKSYLIEKGLSPIDLQINNY